MTAAYAFRGQWAGFGSRFRGQNDTALSPDRANLVVRLVVTEMVILVLTQKLAIPLGGGQIQVSIAIHLAFIFVLLFMRLVAVSQVQTLLYLGTAGVALLIHSIVSNHGYSLPSLLSYLAIYSITCFVIPIGRGEYRRILLAFQLLAAIACFGVWFDWAIQLCGRPMPNIEPLIPKALRLTFYVYLQPVVWGSAWSKPNAIIFPETSFISGFLGIAFVIEMALFRRIRYIGLLCASLFATLGGSGMLLVALTAPLLLNRLKPGAIIGLAVALLVTVLVGAPLGVFDSIAQRSMEFSHEDSSGYHRFIEPLNLLSDSLLRDIPDALFGTGAGTAAKGMNIVWSPLAKAINEYGLLFGVMFFLLTITFMFGSGRPFIIGFACFINYHLLGGGFVVPWFAVFAWILVGGYHIRKPDLIPRIPRLSVVPARSRIGTSEGIPPTLGSEVLSG